MLPIGQSSQESMSNGANVGTIIGISHSDSLPSNMNHGNSMPFSLSPSKYLQVNKHVIQILLFMQTPSAHQMQGFCLRKLPALSQLEVT